MNAVMKSLSLKGAVSGKNSDEMIKLAKTINDSVFSFRSEVSKMIDDLIEENENIKSQQTVMVIPNLVQRLVK